MPIPRKPKTLKITEAQVRSGVKQWAGLNGWYCYWNLQGLGCKPGLADLTILKNGNVIWVELKAPGKKQSPRQIDFEREIKAYGGNYVVAYSYHDVQDYAEEKGIL